MYMCGLNCCLLCLRTLYVYYLVLLAVCSLIYQQVVTFAVQSQPGNLEPIFSRLIQLAILQQESSLQVAGYDVLSMDRLEMLSGHTQSDEMLLDWSPQQVSFWLLGLGVSMAVCCACCTAGDSVTRVKILLSICS